MARGERRVTNKLMILLLILSLIASGLAMYEIFLFNGVETFIRYVIIGLMAWYDIHLIIKVTKIRKGKTKKPPHRKLFITWMIIYIILCLGLAYSLDFVYSRLSHANKSDVTYTSYLVVMANNPVDKIDNAKNMKIALLDDKKNPDGYIIPQEMIRKYKLQDDNEIIDYGDYTSMLADIYAGEIDGMFIPSSYVTLFSGVTGYENIETDTKIIGKMSKTMKKAATSKIETASSGKDIKDPFTILLMGVDSTDEVLDKNEVAHGDTLILITFNPKTLNATMLSIPRDSYVPIACWSGKPENKITHAAVYGNDCMINTIEDYFNTNIDYYVKINFKGLVKLVDAVGGVEVDVPKELCTDDSSRWAQVCIQPGRRVLNGEEALVFARNRKQLEDGDFGRAKHQQEIIMALTNKMKDVKDVKTFMSILDTVSNSMDTNLTTKQILSFYNVGKDIVKRSLSSDDAELVNIQQLYLQGTGQMIYDERAKMVLWDYIPNKSSQKDCIQAMKVNLEKAPHTDITEFHFSINTPYEKKVIGEGPYGATTTYRLLPDFTGDTMETARSSCSALGITCTFNGNGGRVVSQSEPASKRIDLMRSGLTLTLSGQTTNKETTKKDEKKDEKTDDDDKTDDNTGGNSGSSTNTNDDKDKENDNS